MSTDGYGDEGEREHDYCPRCGRGSCPGSGSLGWDGCEDPAWIATDRTGDAHTETLRAVLALLPQDVQWRTCWCEQVAQGRVHLRGADCQPVIPARNEATR